MTCDYANASKLHTADYLWPVVERIIGSSPRRIVDVGSGNGAFAARLTSLGHEVVGLEPSVTGVAVARAAHPAVLFINSPVEAVPPLSPFDVATCLEVIEHCALPRIVANAIYGLLKPGGTAILSTPYHGYLKNLTIAAMGGFDAHLDPLWDHGHIKFWSPRTLGKLLVETGFAEPKILRIGRIPPLAKSMVAVTSRPGSGSAI